MAPSILHLASHGRRIGLAAHTSAFSSGRGGKAWGMLFAQRLPNGFHVMRIKELNPPGVGLTMDMAQSGRAKGEARCLNRWELTGSPISTG